LTLATGMATPSAFLCLLTALAAAGDPAAQGLRAS